MTGGKLPVIIESVGLPLKPSRRQTSFRRINAWNAEPIADAEGGMGAN